LKAHYPAEYMAALLTASKRDKDRTALYLNECRTMGLRVLVPDVNRSESDFAAVDGEITFGLSAIRNVGEAVVELIVTEREKNGPYGTIEGFLNRVDLSVLNKRVLESLVKAGAFDSMGYSRKGLLLTLLGGDDALGGNLLDAVIARRRAEDMGQYSLFGGADSAIDTARVEVQETEWHKRTRLGFEKEMLGLYVSDHPLLGVEGALRQMCTATIPGLWDLEDKSRATIGGIVGAITTRFTKTGDRMLFFSFEDLTGSTEVICFPKAVAEYGPFVREDAILVIGGRVDHRGDDVKFIAQEVREPELREGDMVRLRVPATVLSRNMVDRLKEVLGSHPGPAPVYLHMLSENGEKVIRLGDEHRVEPRSSLFAELRTLLGPKAVL
jgi:DNA polymerase-3 subunit alpha